MSQKIIRQPNDKYSFTSYPNRPPFQYCIVWIHFLSTAFATLNDKGKRKIFLTTDKQVEAHKVILGYSQEQWCSLMLQSNALKQE